MKYFVYLLCVSLWGWMVYLCRRAFLPRIPGQIGIYRAITPVQMIAMTAFVGMLLTVAAFAASEGGAAWFITGCILGIAGLPAWATGKSITQNVVFLSYRGLFGPPVTYRWEDVSACTVRREETRGRFSHFYDMYRLTLPDRVLAISNSEDAGRALLQVFERKRPELQAVRQTEQHK